MIFLNIAVVGARRDFLFVLYFSLPLVKRYVTRGVPSLLVGEQSEVLVCEEAGCPLDDGLLQAGVAVLVPLIGLNNQGFCHKI